METFRLNDSTTTAITVSTHTYIQIYISTPNPLSRLNKSEI